MYHPSSLLRSGFLASLTLTFPPAVYVEIYATEDGGLYLESVMSSGWEGCTIVVFSCVVGTVISHAGTACRELLSATSFNVAGNLNKVPNYSPLLLNYLFLI
jgi:hypothetical protein